MRKINVKSILAGLAATAIAATGFAQTTATFSNPALITIPSSGIASLYPSNITVSGMPTGVTNVAVRLNKLNHTWASDVDVAVVAPSGQVVLLMSDMGSSGDFVNTTYTFIDGFPLLSTSTALGSGTYRPSEAAATGPDNFPAPGPGNVTQTNPLLSNFNGIDPNGVWKLYVVDDAAGDLGNVSAGWDLIITSGALCPAPTALTASAVTTNSATVSWSATVLGSFAVEYGPAGFTPGTGTLITTAATSVNITGLNPSTAYDVRVVQICGTGSSTIAGPTTFNTLAVGDDPCIALPIAVNSSCVLTSGTTAGTTASAVAQPSCPGTASYDDDVWYTFVAPASGVVSITGAAGSASDLVASVYSAPSCAGPFTEIGCNDDGGVSLLPGLQVSGLTPGTTYYLRWATYSTGTPGSYGVCVSEPAPCAGTATGPAVVCGVPANVNLSVSSGAFEPVFQWQEEAPVGSGTWVNIGGTTTSTTLSLTVASAGPRRYRALVSSFSCVTAPTNNVDVIVDAPATPSAANVTRCGAGSVTLSATSGTGSVRWFDAASGGTLLSTSNNFTTSVSASSTFYVESINPSTGCTSSRVAVSVTVNALPTVSASASANETCDNSCVTLSASGSVSGAASLTFSNNNSSPIADLGTVNSTINVAGVNPATLSATSVVNVTLNLTHTFDGDLDISLISPSGTTIDLTSDNGSLGDNYTNTVFQTGAPSVTGGAAPFTGTFSPEQPFSDLTGNANGTWTLRIVDDASLDVGTLLSWSVTLQNAVSNTVNFTWSGPGLSGTSGSSVAACPNLGNTSAQTVAYTVTATDPSTGCSTDATVNVQVNPLPVATCTKPAAGANNNGADITLGYGPQSVTLGNPASGGTPGYTYNWSGPNMSCTTCATPTVSPTATSVYSVTVTDAKGCQASCSITVCVIDARCGNGKVAVCHLPPGNPGNAQNLCIAAAAVPTHLSGHGDYLGACGASPCGTNKGVRGGDSLDKVMDNIIVTAMPNPFGTMTTITVALTSDDHVALEVFSLQGVRVATLFEGNLEAGINHNFEFKPETMANGVYFARMTTGAGEVKHIKLVLQR